MRLVSINTWKAEGAYHLRLHALTEGLATLEPDVIALQEDLRTIDGHTHTAQTIGKELGLHVSWLPARVKLRKVLQRWTLTSSGLAILTREPVSEQREIPLSCDVRDGQRSAQGVRLPPQLGGGWLFNLHQSHLPDRADLRREQLATVLLKAEEWASDTRWILCGDFNASASDPEVSWAVQPRGPLVNAFAEVSKATHSDAHGLLKDIDHIFYRQISKHDRSARRAWVALNETSRYGVRPSDHFAICADFF